MALGSFPKPGSVVILKPGETLVTGDDYQEYTITLGTLANAFIVLYGTQYDTTKMIDPGATIGLAFNHTISGGQSITLKSNESFAIKIFQLTSCMNLIS